jgi:hypothetical protein
MIFIHKNCTKQKEENFKKNNLKNEEKEETIYLVINAPMLANWVPIKITKV